jgi:hypothetical protein
MFKGRRDVRWLCGCLCIAGCGALDEAREAWEELTHPVLVEGLVTSVAIPYSREVERILAGSGYMPGITVEVWVGEAYLDSNWKSVPLPDAEVTFCADEIQELTSHGDGNYSLGPLEELAYEPGAVWVLEADTPGLATVGHVTISLPPPLDLWLPPAHHQGEPLVIDLGGMGEEYDALIWVVLGADGGLLWSNQPEDIAPEETYTFARAGLPESLTVPAEAFPAPGVQLMGWAGLKTNSPDEASDVNRLLSTVMAGQFQFSMVRVQEQRPR